MTLTNTSRRAAAVLLAGAALAAGACTAGPTPGPGPVNPNPNPNPPPAQPDGDTTRYRAVHAEGPGCPPGSTYTSVSGDGLVFTTTFSAFGTQLEPGQGGAANSCRFIIRVHAPSGQSVALHQFAYSGYLNLTNGMQAYFNTRYFTPAGTPLATRNPARGPAHGPTDRDFVNVDELSVTDAMWTPCGGETDIIADVQISLVNATLQGAGAVNVSAFDSTVAMQARTQARPCG